MLKFRIYILFLLVLLLNGCARKSGGNTPFLSVSIEPQRYFVEKIVGDKFQVKSLVPSGSSPESFDPSPSQMVVFGDSKAYFFIGLFPFEQKWSNMLKETNPQVALVNCSSNISPQDLLKHDHEEAHSGQELSDPHIWSSPKMALALSKSILDGIEQVDPKNKAYYEKNYRALTIEIQQTDSIVKSKLANATNKTFIIYHPALSYFAREYGLEQYSVEFDGKSPSPAQMAELVSLAKAKGVKTIFVQPEFDKKNALVLAREIGGKIVEINPLEYNWKAETIKIAEAIGKQ